MRPALVVRIPMRFQRRGGRKRIVAPDGGEVVPTSKPQPDGTLVKALARAWRWQRMLDEGRFASVRELAEAERVGLSYISRILRLNLLAPDIVERILEGRRAPQLAQLMQPFPVEWEWQRETLARDVPLLRYSRIRARPRVAPSSGLIRAEVLAAVVCVDRLMAAPDVGVQLTALKGMERSYQQSKFVEEGGWAIIVPASDATDYKARADDRKAAGLCAEELAKRAIPPAGEAAQANDGAIVAQ